MLTAATLVALGIGMAALMFFVSRYGDRFVVFFCATAAAMCLGHGAYDFWSHK